MVNSSTLIEQLERGFIRVLVVDDDPDIMDGMKDILENSGYTVETAASATEARRHLQKGPFSLMVADYSLPDDNGIVLSHDAKKMQPFLGLLLITGHDPRHFRKTLISGDIELMRKPVDVSALLDALDRITKEQCQTLKIDWKKPEAEPLNINPIPIPIPISVVDPLPLPAPEQIDLPEYSATHTKWTPAMSWAATALVAFGIGWISRSTLPTSVKKAPAQVTVHTDRSISLVPTQPLPSAEVDPQAPEETPTTEGEAVTEVKEEPAAQLSRLEDADPVVRIGAAKALLKENPQNFKALNALVAILMDPQSKKHLAAIEAISTTGAASPEVISSLEKALHDADPSVVNAATIILGRLGHSTPAAQGEGPRTPPSVDADALPDRVDALQAATTPNPINLSNVRY